MSPPKTIFKSIHARVSVRILQRLMRPRRFRQIRRVGSAWRAPPAAAAATAAVDVSIGSHEVDDLDQDPDNEHLVNRYFID